MWRLWFIFLSRISTFDLGVSPGSAVTTVDFGNDVRFAVVSVAPNSAVVLATLDSTLSAILGLYFGAIA